MYSDSELLTHRKWRHSQVLVERFWASFIKDYLQSFQTRQKWKLDGNPIAPSTIVMIVDPQLPHGHWPVGTVTTETFSKGKHLINPVSRLIVLSELTDDADITVVLIFLNTNICYVYTNICLCICGGCCRKYCYHHVILLAGQIIMRTPVASY